ncbi:biopolymer transporter ExbD [Phormidium tenue FACHB-886]|nr:biopolymer transporter ExbD [Phormidium tenue FACHB-886]
MKLNFDSPEPEVRIDIVPLIDVIFCILTFFILAAVTLTRQTAINVDLPKAASAAAQMRKLLIITVDPIGQIYVEKQPVSPEQLFQAVGNFRQASPEGTIVLYASRAASYNDVVYVLDQIRAVGGDRVALATLPGTTVPTTAPGETVPGLGNSEFLPDPSSGLGGTNPPAPLPSTLPGLSPGSSTSPLNQPAGLAPAPSGSSTAPSSAPRGNTGSAPSLP